MHYALLDANRLGYELTPVQNLTPNHVSLYRGSEDPQLTESSPRLFWYEPGDTFAQWLDQHWGDAWGISLVSDAQPDEVRKHLRRFLKVKIENEPPVYFRYYDPQVLLLFLPTCDAEQIRTFFGPIDQYVVDDPANQQQVVFTQQGGILRSETISRPTESVS